MTRSIPRLLALGALAGQVGCAANMPGPGGVTPALLINSTTTPGALTSDVVYAAYPDSFVVQGMVEGTSSSVNVLGLFSFGNGGYRAAVDDAKRRASADELVNCVADVKSTSFLGIFSASRTIVRGLAVRQKR